MVTTRAGHAKKISGAELDDDDGDNHGMYLEDLFDDGTNHGLSLEDVQARATSQHAKVDLKPFIISVILIYCLSDTINLFCFLFFILFNKLITFSTS
jgi:hypothetical protein